MNRYVFFFSSRRRHTRCSRDWSSDVCSSDLVGYHLAKLLAAEGARLVVTDIDPERVRRVVDECRAQAVPPDDIYGVRADVFAPCALGAVINDATLPRLQVEIVAGGAHNQPAPGRARGPPGGRGTTSAPDYRIN